MKITIDGQDYTSALDAVRPLTIERRLNEPSTFQCWLTLPQNCELPVPIRNQAIRIVGDDGTIYFTGYVAAPPTPEYAGCGIEGPRYRFELRGISDEYLLDQAGLRPTAGATGVDAGALIAALIKKTGTSALSSPNLPLGAAAGRFNLQSGSSFSRNAGEIANQVRGAYRALDGKLSLATIPRVVHPMSEGDGCLSLGNLSFSENARRSIANDITVCGEHEPAEYVTEYFQGDGVTTQFYLSERPYSPPSARTTIIREQFNEAEIDTRVWSNTGVQGYLAPGSGGLAMQGGTGRDGEVQLTWCDPVEMGGTLLLEAAGVTLADGSAGVLAGFFTGEGTQNACTAGFYVAAEQGSGAVSVQPMVLGNPVGSVYSIDPASQYTLRLRVHCPECQREFATYRSFGDNGPVSAGGEWNIASAALVFEIQEFVNGVAGMPVTLYDGQISSLPGSCRVVAASSLKLEGSMRSLELTDLGSGWVITTPAGGTAITRRLGTPAQSAECRVESGGMLLFYPGFAPRAGEQIKVSCRSRRRAVGRAVNESDQQSLAQAGLPEVSAWIGSVRSPMARSSHDCRTAAIVLGQTAATPNSLWRGQYDCTSASLDEDIWPGDALQVDVSAAGLNALLIVRAVKLTYSSSYPDLLHYASSFANDWAEDLGIKTSGSVPEDAWLPAPIEPAYAPNLSTLEVTAMNGNTVTINTGTVAPPGGGFEVRRRDNCFMPGTDSELVMRGSQPTMSFIRGSASDRFYIRMFDGATPPNYSEFSATLIFNLPLAA